MKKAAFLTLILIVSLFVAACGEDVAEIDRNQIETDDSALSFDFENGASGFETGSFGESSQTVADGQYQITSYNDRGNHYLVGSNPDIALKNVIISVETNQVSGNDNAWYGVVCRTHNNDLGFALLISSDGFWSIARITESVSGLQSLDYLENWVESDAINTEGSNQLEAYCVDDYLALYANRAFVGDHRNGNYNLAGGAGFLAGTVEDERVTIAFDNVEVRSAFREGNPNTETPPPTPTATPAVIETLPPLDSLGGDNDNSADTPDELNE